MIINQTESLNEQLELENLHLLQNYSVLLNKLEQLALDVNKELETLSNVDLMSTNDISSSGSTGSSGSSVSTGPHISFTHGLEDIEYTRVVSDIWVGIILTLLIICVIILICVGFIYHKFQQWKLSYRTNRNREPVEICRNYTTNYEVESLPSYTIVSGLPTYDDAIEEFRKSGIILTPQIPIIKVFETKDTKAKDLYGIENENTCACASANTNVNNLLTPTPTPTPTQTPTISASMSESPSPMLSPNTNSQLIELTPEKLAQLSDKRLSLRIAFGSQSQRISRSCHDMRNNLLHSRALTYNVTTPTSYDSNSSTISQRPRSSASFSTSTNNYE